MKGKILGMMAVALLVAVAACSNSAASADAQTSNDSMANQQPDSALTLVKFETSLGDFTVELFNDTPIHRDNFIKLVNEGYYNGVLFHRVINEFMVQTGDPDSKTAQPGQRLGAGGPGYTLDAEILYPQHFHRRYALAAARQGDQVNPQKRSSGSQFYIVTGKRVLPAQLDQLSNQLKNQQLQSIFNGLAQQHIDRIRALQAAEDRDALSALRDSLIAETEAIAAKNPITITDEVRQAYTSVGGTPHLDGAYTVFGQVVDGTAVIDSIESVATDGADRPKEDIRIISAAIVK